VFDGFATHEPLGLGGAIMPPQWAGTTGNLSRDSRSFVATVRWARQFVRLTGPVRPRQPCVWRIHSEPSHAGGGQASCPLYDLTSNETPIARVMYSREPGNLEPGKDGPPPTPPVYTRRDDAPSRPASSVVTASLT